jgi:hypothetical protein
MKSSLVDHMPLASLDAASVRQDFPIFDQLVYGKPLVFLDSAASSQKPVQVLDAMDRVYRTTYANVHRGVYAFSERSTELYDQARERIADIAFSGDGCVISQAATSMLMDVVVGKSVDEVQRLDRHAVPDLLGVPLTPTRVKCAVLGLKVLQAGLYRELANQPSGVVNAASAT